MNTRPKETNTSKINNMNKPLNVSRKLSNLIQMTMSTILIGRPVMPAQMHSNLHLKTLINVSNSILILLKDILEKVLPYSS